MLLRSACVPVPDAWFADHKAAIQHESALLFQEYFKQHKTWHSCAPITRELEERTYAMVVQEYRRHLALDAARACDPFWLCLPYGCAFDRKRCPVFQMGYAFLCVMRAESKRGTPEARAFFCNCLPADMLRQEIYERLDVSSRRAWRIADPHVRALTPIPQDSRDWSRHLAYDRGLDVATPLPRLFVRACQEAFDNRLTSQRVDQCITWMRTERVRKEVLPIKAIASCLAQAAAMGGAVDAYRHCDASLFRSCGFNLDRSYGYSVVPSMRCALANGQFEFIRSVWNVAPKSTGLFQAVRQTFFEGPTLQGVACGHHPVVYLLRHQHHYDWIDWFLELTLAEPTTTTTTSSSHNLVSCGAIDARVRHLLWACARYGHLPWVERFKDAWRADIVCHLVDTAQSTVTLRWLERHRPDLFADLTYLTRRATQHVRSALSRDAVDILAWLRDHGILQLPRDGPQLLADAQKHRRTKALTWLRAETLVI